MNDQLPTVPCTLTRLCFSSTPVVKVRLDMKCKAFYHLNALSDKKMMSQITPKHMVDNIILLKL